MLIETNEGMSSKRSGLDRAPKPTHQLFSRQDKSRRGTWLCSQASAHTSITSLEATREQLGGSSAHSPKTFGKFGTKASTYVAWLSSVPLNKVSTKRRDEAHKPHSEQAAVTSLGTTETGSAMNQPQVPLS